MLEVADYRADGPLRLSVRLKCSCGGRRVLKVLAGGKDVFKCIQCGSSTSIQDLKNNASSYWRGRVWVVEAEEARVEDDNVGIYYPATLIIRSTARSEILGQLTGACVQLNDSSVLFLAKDFQISWFEEIKQDHRAAEIGFEDHINGLPPKLFGQIVEIRYREDELPVCRIRIELENIASSEKEMIVEHLNHLRERTIHWVAD